MAECFRCDSEDVRYLDDLDYPFCAPCSTVVAAMSPDVLPMRPIEAVTRG